jgi:voltage-gated potassium channel Kch
VNRERFHLLRQFAVNALTLASAVVFFYFVPIDIRGVHPLREIVLFVGGLAVLIWLIVRQLIKQMNAGPDPGVRVRSLITLLYPVVVLFALTYYVIQVHSPQQFDGIVTRTDSLYYTVVTLGTVGYGDVHAVGQLAKVVTIIQVAFDLVVIGALIAVASSRFQVVPTRRSTKKAPDGNPAEPATD